MSTVFAFVHLVVAALWVGSMAYSLTVVQPKVAIFFEDVTRREEFLVRLANGNRWRVVGLIAVLLLTGIGVVLSAPALSAVCFGIALGLDVVAALVFVEVSWRHWPARVFALPAEIPAYQSALRRRAWTMLALVGLGFGIALGSTVFFGVR
ncbi:hypothetical protein GCM10009765_11680 [Fodinicola feengrottensis]|uniref:Copper resistance protein D domain-containing protein n=1 Tax=Fodinicola feengrottensis TaxID=435914 RepID=A0ABN2G1T9_9ACTN